MKSNVSVKSNVYIRQAVDLSRDQSFLRQIRGRDALVKIVKRLPSARGLLTARQTAELAWERRCDICGAIPEGPVSRDGVEQILFRCPRGQCKTQAYRSRVVFLDLNLVAEATTKTRMTPPEIVRKALDRLRPCPGSLARRNGRSATRRFVLKLTPYEFYFFSDEEIESAIFSFITEEPWQK